MSAILKFIPLATTLTTLPVDAFSAPKAPLRDLVARVTMLPSGDFVSAAPSQTPSLAVTPSLGGARPMALHDHMLVVPPGTDASLSVYLPLPEIERLERLAGSTREARRTLLQSDDPIRRAEGIFAAAFSGDIDSLVEARGLLQDDRPAVGVWMPTADRLMIPTRDLHRLLDLPNAPPRNPLADAAVTQLTVRGYLATMYRRYFGLADGMSLDDMTVFIAERAARNDSWTFAHAWSARYEACMTPESASETLGLILKLPENLRWAVAGEIMRTKGFNRALAVDHATLIAASLPVATRRSIESHSMPIPPDPVYAAQPHRMAAIYHAFESIPREK